MDIKWNFVVALPGINLPSSIDLGTTAAVPHLDPRYQKLMADYPSLGQYLNSFVSPFGTPLKPTIIIQRSGLPLIKAPELTAFRNIIAVSSVIMSKAETYRTYPSSGLAQGARFSDLFDIYPVNWAADPTHVLIDTAGEKGFHQLKKFRGQPAPVLANPGNVKPRYDEFLLTALSEIWKKPSRKKELRQFRARIFRSLDMAYYALCAPFSHLGNRTDHGLVLSLWVSAFEILANPGTAEVKFPDVSKLIKDVPWLSSSLRRKAYRPIDLRPRRGSNPWPNTTKAVQIYGRLYHSRNMILHGSPLPKIGIEAKTRKGWGPLDIQVAILYRSALLHLLSLKGYGSFPSKTGNRKIRPRDIAAWSRSYKEPYYQDRFFEEPLYNSKWDFVS